MKPAPSRRLEVSIPSRASSCEGCRVRKSRCSRTENCAGCQARRQPCVWTDGTGPSRTEEEATIDAQDKEIRRLNALVRRLSRQVLSLGGTLEDEECVRYATTSSARPSISLEVPPSSPASSLAWSDRRDSSASSASAFSLATPSDEPPQVWPASYFDFRLSMDDKAPAEPARREKAVAPPSSSSSGYTFPSPPPHVSLVIPSYPTFPTAVAPSALSRALGTNSRPLPSSSSTTYHPALEPCTAHYGTSEDLAFTAVDAAGGVAPALVLYAPEQFERARTRTC
ncbi:hypothetical protein JCM10449v2_000380 [Rhodotorula kratochvilovae]